MSDKIEPAVTPEEWKEFRAGELHTTRLGFHATAALSLHGKPFGFTWEDVDRLRKAEIIYFIPSYGDQGRRVDVRRPTPMGTSGGPDGSRRATHAQPEGPRSYTCAAPPRGVAV